MPVSLTFCCWGNVSEYMWIYYNSVCECNQFISRVSANYGVCICIITCSHHVLFLSFTFCNLKFLLPLVCMYKLYFSLDSLQVIRSGLVRSALPMHGTHPSASQLTHPRRATVVWLLQDTTLLAVIIKRSTCLLLAQTGTLCTTRPVLTWPSES